MEQFGGALLFGIIGFIVNAIAYKKGFFHLPPFAFQKKEISFKQVISIFAIYLVISLIFIPLIMKIVIAITKPEGKESLTLVSLTQLSSALITLAFFALYLLSQSRSVMKSLWKVPNSSSSIGKNLLMGLLGWLLSLPVVIAIHQFCEGINFLIFGRAGAEQVAVKIFKMVMPSTPHLLITIFTIVLIAPIIEEILFRGFLQSWLKKYVGLKWGIISSALCFTLFHFAFTQGIGNFPLLVTLFFLALYLGFIYEREGSLYSSIVLHMTFNSVSVMRILVFNEI